MKVSAGSSLTRGTRILTALYCLVLIILSVIPSVEVPGVGVSDWILHAVAYGGCGGMFLASRFKALHSVAAASALGLATEFLQLLVPYRRFQWSDLTADVVGALVAVFIGVLIMRVLIPTRRADR